MSYWNGDLCYKCGNDHLLNKTKHNLALIKRNNVPDDKNKIPGNCQLCGKKSDNVY